MRSRQRAMTLIELIFVMGLLAVVLAIASPVLSGFVRGRKLQEEARRFLALTRYARSEAISRGVCMELRINAESGKYGLYPQVSYGAGARPPVEFEVSEGLSIEAKENASEGKTNAKTGVRASLATAFKTHAENLPKTGGKTEENEATILFWPDGIIDVDSPENVRIAEKSNAGGNGDSLTIHRVDVFSGYEIRSGDENA
jgi:prepilin-type N-terminal cleavage/methylation domain-containing protein